MGEYITVNMHAATCDALPLVQGRRAAPSNRRFDELRAHGGVSFSRNFGAKGVRYVSYTNVLRAMHFQSNQERQPNSTRVFERKERARVPALS